jgi:SWIM zinc finger
MLNLNVTVLSQIVDQAMQDAADHPRWIAAINRAVVELLSNPYMHREDHGGLLIASSSSDRIYSANGSCQCQAFQHGQPCWHRAAARLVRLHDEALAKVETDADQTARQAAAAQLADRVIAVVAQCTETPADRYARACREVDELYA